jgi:hypothetical protein
VKAKSHDRVSRDLYFCYRGRHYVHGKPALRILKHLVCPACKDAGA